VKNAISTFAVSPVSEEALVRWGGKIKHLLIAYFLSNMSANWLLYVKVTTRRTWDVFWNTLYTETTDYM